MSKITTISGRGIAVVGDDIDTDRIIPARYLKEITFSKMGDYPFYDERFNSDGSKKNHPFNDPRNQGANILFANVNFGCGSSREHAPQALVRWGIRAIVAESFSEIFAGNCVMLGTPALIASKDDILSMQKSVIKNPDAEFVLDLVTMNINGAGLSVKVTMPESNRKALTEGTWDITEILLGNSDKTKEVAGKLDYMKKIKHTIDGKELIIEIDLELIDDYIKKNKFQNSTFSGSRDNDLTAKFVGGEFGSMFESILNFYESEKFPQKGILRINSKFEVNEIETN